MSTIRERIRWIRKIHEHNQVVFSNIIGVSQGTLSELEQDKYKPASVINETLTFPFLDPLLFD